MLNNTTDERTKCALITEGARLDAVKYLQKFWINMILPVELSRVSNSAFSLGLRYIRGDV